MKDFESWSFRNRSFATALSLSVLWHAFWFFSLTITINSNKKVSKPKPEVISLGLVLDDKIFRTLIENRPELSKTFYRRLSDFSSPVEIQTKTAERYTAGSVVSLPFGKKSWDRVRGLIGGSKTSPERELASKIEIRYADESARIEGELKARPLLSRPAEPEPPLGIESAVRNAEVTIDFTVDPSGSVTAAQAVLSSGDPELDLLWVRYLRHWQFAPVNAEKPALEQKGKIRFHFKPVKE